MELWYILGITKKRIRYRLAWSRPFTTCDEIEPTRVFHAVTYPRQFSSRSVDIRETDGIIEHGHGYGCTWPSNKNCYTMTTITCIACLCLYLLTYFLTRLIELYSIFVLDGGDWPLWHLQWLLDRRLTTRSDVAEKCKMASLVSATNVVECEQALTPHTQPESGDVRYRRCHVVRNISGIR